MKVLNNLNFLNVALCTKFLIIFIICAASNSNTVVIANENCDNDSLALNQHQDWQPRAPEVIAHIKSEDISVFFRRLVFTGIALIDDNYHFWGASPIWGPDGKIHLFASRWPVDKNAGIDKRKGINGFWNLTDECEIAHYIADRPEGPFVFSDVALKGTGRTNWDSRCAHNPDIKKVGNQYVLTYVSMNHKTGYQIGMAVSKNLHGPWKRIGRNGLVFGLKDGLTENNWDRKAANVCNPCLLPLPNGKFHLYYRALIPIRPAPKNGAPYKKNIGLAIADNLEGPYIRHPEPLINDHKLREDPLVFVEEGKYYLLYHRLYLGGKLPFAWSSSAIHESDDGIYFLQKPKLAIPPMNYYWGEHSENGKPYPCYWWEFRADMLKILTKNGRPTHLFTASATNIEGGSGTCNYVFKIKPKESNSESNNNPANTKP